MSKFGEGFHRRVEEVKRRRTEGTLPQFPPRSWEHFPPGTRRLEPSGFGPNATISAPTMAEVQAKREALLSSIRRDKVIRTVKIIAVSLLAITVVVYLLLRR